MKQKVQSTAIIIMLVLTLLTISIPINAKADETEYIVPAEVQIGDLLFMDSHNRGKWAIPGFYNDHVALYIGNNSFVHTELDVIKIDDFSLFCSWTATLAFARVINASQEQIQGAIDFALDRIGSEYQDFFRFSRKIADPYYPHFSSKIWYCMEFVWAAYYNQGIDIDRNEWFPTPRFAFVTGNDILYDDDIEIYLLYGDTPSAPSGLANGFIFRAYTYTAPSIEGNESMYYQWYWGGPFYGYSDKWRLYDPSDDISVKHRWFTPGFHYVKYRTKDNYDDISQWSDALVLRVRWL